MSATPRDRRVPKPRDRVEVDVPVKGELIPHRAVVLHVEKDMVILAVGTSKQIDTYVEIVRIDRQPQLTTMRLDPKLTTYFYEEHVHPVAWDGRELDIWARCPPTEFNRLFQAMEKIAREVAAGTRTILPIPRYATALPKKMASTTFAIPKATVHTPPPVPVAAAVSAEIKDEASDATVAPADDPSM